MTTATKRRLMAGVLAVSVAYNVAWVLASVPLQKQVCTAHLGLIISAAVESESARNWHRAAALSGYLAETRGTEVDCRPVFPEMSLATPLASILLELRYGSDQPERHGEADVLLFRERFARALAEISDVTAQPLDRADYRGPVHDE